MQNSIIKKPRSYDRGLMGAAGYYYWQIAVSK